MRVMQKQKLRLNLQPSNVCGAGGVEGEFWRLRHPGLR